MAIRHGDDPAYCMQMADAESRLGRAERLTLHMQS